MNNKVQDGDKIVSLVSWLDTLKDTIYTVDYATTQGVWLKETGDYLSNHEYEPVVTGQETKPNLESRYTTGSGKQLYDIMEDDLLEPDEARGFYKGNIYKYVKRYPKKNGIEDLEKARDYINQLIELEKKLGEVDWSHMQKLWNKLDKNVSKF